MSRKFSEARRAAFVRAVRETGNQALGAERARVSRSWVTLARKEDAAFDAAVRDAVAAAKASLDARATGGSTKPPTGWGTLDGVALVVRGTNGRRCQIARARTREWCPRTEDRFLRVLAATCNVKAACAEAGMRPPSAYNHRRRWPAFARRWDEALAWGYDRLELALVENAGNVFSGEALPPEMPMPPVTAAEAIQLLKLHGHRVHGTGKPLRIPRRRPIEEIHASILRKIEAIKRGAHVTAEEKARQEAEWGPRRLG